MSDTKTRDSSTPGDVDVGPADTAALLMRCCARTRPLRPEALQAVERLKAACREEARGHRELAARMIAQYSALLPATVRWHPPPIRQPAPDGLTTT
jgi:hypothetical protein